MPILSELLSKNRNFSPIFHPKRLSNHLSMALIALDKLGASDEQLKDYFEAYSSELEPVPALSKSVTIDDHNWKEFLGDTECYANYLNFFHSKIHAIGIINTLKKYLQSLIKGVSGQAFHCLIRLAYAVEINDPDEIAVALAYFSSHYLLLGNKNNGTPISQEPETILDKINGIKSLTDISVSGINITEQFKKVALLPEFSPIIDWLQPTPTTLADAAPVLICLYATTKNFTVLHMVTATHAMRILQPYFTDLPNALSYYWQAICAAYISIGSPRITQFAIPLGEAKSSWPTIFARTTHATDEHIIKLIYTCHEEARIYNNPLYLHIANAQ